jgi:ABC-type transport system substrate-binding protein
MSRRFGLALATLAAGAVLLATSAVGVSAPAKSDGILRVGSTGNLDSVDPAIAYGTTSWMFENSSTASAPPSRHLRTGSITVAYQSAGRVGPATAELVRQALVGLGFDSSRIDMRGFAGFPCCGPRIT